jgi:adenylate cyclase
MPPVRRLTAILAADVAGYSRLMGMDEEGTHDRLKAHLRELVDPKIKEHRGRIVKNTGDGFLAEFASVVDAVRCAVEIQRGMAEREPDVPEERRIRFRIGVNLGDVIVEEDDIFGDGVNVAARLEALAEPGGICVSRVVRDQVRDRLDYTFEDLGEQQVKNIARPVRVYALRPEAVADPLKSRLPIALRRRKRGIAAMGAAVAALLVAIVAWWGWPAIRSSPTAPAAVVAAPTSIAQPLVAPRLSMVVLPFANLSNDPDQEYFADGITDDLTSDLSRISGSFVIARTTAFTYKGKTVDAKQIGRELGVRYVIEGSIRRAGEQIQVNVQLIDADTGAHVWADRFDTNRTLLPEAQNEIIGRLARSLNLELVREVGRRIEQERMVDPGARDLVMRAWARLYGPGYPASANEALGVFEQALAIDPQSIDAKLGIARILASRIADGLSKSIQQDEVRAEQLISEILERDPNRSTAHTALGVLRRTEGRLAEALTEFEAAVAFDQNDAYALRQLGLTLSISGQPEAAIPNFEKAIRLNPREPSIAYAYGSLGSNHLFLGHVNEAIDLLRKAQAENPRVWRIHLCLAGALGLKGDLDAARVEVADALKLKPEVNSVAQWRAIGATMGLGDPRFQTLMEKTIYAGLRKAGMPEE